MNDSGVWDKSDLRDKIENTELGIPEGAPLSHGHIDMPYVFVGDDAFALKPYMMKPYPQTADKRIYNYRHSRARRISENVYLASRWRVFRTVLNLGPEKASVITTCALALHNFLRKTNSRSVYSPPGLADCESVDGKLVKGSWRSESTPVAFLNLEPPVHGNNPPRSAQLIREAFNEYFMRAVLSGSGNKGKRHILI